MSYKFKKHYTIEEARALLPLVRRWFDELERLRREIPERDSSLKPAIQEGRDIGGHMVNEGIKAIAEVKDLLSEFDVREIQIKDLDRGLIDFPAVINGKEVFLCWERDEADIEFWHDIDAGYAGREKLEE